MFGVTDCISCAVSEGDLLGTENINIDSNLQKRDACSMEKFLEVSFSTHPQSLKDGISLVLEANTSLKSVVWKTRIF